MNQPNMQDTLHHLLAELYAADSSLREKESVLRPLLSQLLESKPEAVMDPVFRASLKQQLLERARTAPQHSASGFTSYFSYMNKHLSYGLGGAVIIALLAIPFVYLNRPKVQLAVSPEVDTVQEERAFGPLVVQDGTSSGMGGRGGGGGGDMATARPQSGGGGGGGSAGLAMPMDPGSYQVPRFTYSGTLDLSAKTVQVFQRRKGQIAQGSLSSLVNSFDLGDMMNLKSFSGLALQTITLAQDIEYGYSVYVDFGEGTVGVNQNWQRWPNPFAGCRDTQCYENGRIRENQIPSDSEAISLANAFLANHGITLAGYGAPEIMKDWAIAYERASAAERLAWYFPEQVMVVYPLTVQGMTVYEEGGNKAGVTVGIDIRTRRVSMVNGLTTQQYDASSYEAVTDASTVIRALQYANWRDLGNVSYDRGTSFADIAVGDPTQALMRTWIPDATPSGREILVPALVFPVGKVPSDTPVWQQNIVVPLAKELYTQSSSGGPVMPLAN
jgi:hypothetical protein